VAATHFIAGTLTEVGHHGAQIDALRDLYGIPHATIQIEVGDHPVCAVSPDHVC